MTNTFVQKADLSAAFTNDNTNGAGGISPRIAPGATQRLSLDPVSGLAVNLPNAGNHLLANLPTLTAADRGVSFGTVRVPGTRALTVAEFALGQTIVMSPALRDMQNVYGNRAVEASTRGNMNPNGFLGHSFQYQLDWDPANLDYNGAFLAYPVLAGDLELSDARYGGQVLKIRVRQGDTTIPLGTEVVLRMAAGTVGRFTGVARRLDHRIVRLTEADDIIIRVGDVLTLTGLPGGSWNVEHETFMLRGVNWREETDGTATVWGTLLGAAAGTVNLPEAFTNTEYRVTTSAGAAVSNKTTGAFDLSTGCDYMVMGGRLDYVALGGIASV